jgi:membrane protein YqaA with SNARE-associated domain
MKLWISQLKSKIWEWGHTKWAGWAIFLFALADASFLPLPTLMFIIAITLLNINQAYKYFLFATTGSILGSLIGYAAGNLAWLNAQGEFTVFAQFFMDHVPGFSASVYNEIQGYYVRWDFWILFLAAFIPVPYKIFAISSGVFDINLFVFIIGTLISQSLKYYLLAMLIVKLGPDINRLIKKRLKPIAIIAAASVAIILLAIKLL